MLKLKQPGTRRSNSHNNSPKKEITWNLEKKQHCHWERDNKKQILKWVIFHWKYNIPTIQGALTPPRPPAFHPPAEMSSPVKSACARHAGAQYDGNNPAVVLQWYTEGWDSCTCTSESWRTSQWWMWERCAASALHACFRMSGKTSSYIPNARACASILRQALVNLLSFWFELKTSQHKRNNVNLPGNLM